MGYVWVGVVWMCILLFVWLRGKIPVGEWCCEVVESCEVEQLARCSFLLPRNLIKTCMLALCYLYSLVKMDCGVLFYLV